jgi:hypothetical protein
MDKLSNAGRAEAFIYRPAPRPVRAWKGSGEWAKPAGKRAVPDAAWDSYERYMDDVDNKQDPGKAWEDHEKRMGTWVPTRQGNRWQ